MKKFEMAQIEIEKFEIMDVITASGDQSCDFDCPDDYCPNATDWA